MPAPRSSRNLDGGPSPIVLLSKDILPLPLPNLVLSGEVPFGEDDGEEESAGQVIVDKLSS